MIAWQTDIKEPAEDNATKNQKPTAARPEVVRYPAIGGAKGVAGRCGTRAAS